MSRALLVPLLLLGGMAPAIPQAARESARAFAAAEAAGGQVTYRMASGDTLEGLARAHFVRPDLWRRAQMANGIADPRRIPVGAELTLNTAWLNHRPLEARVSAFRGEVTILRAGTLIPVEVGTVAREGDIVATARHAFVTFSMPDASLVTMPSASTIRIARLRQFTLGEAIERRFELVSGRVEARVRPLNSEQSRFEISTPVAVAAVRGTQFRMRFAPEEMRATEETIEGKVGVAGSRGAERLVPAGFGTFATRDAGPAAPVPLLPAPVIEQPAQVQAGQKVAFRFSPIPGARRYLVELATDAGFIDRFASIETSEPVAEFEDVPDGTLFVRASAIDALGLVGRPVTQSFERRKAWTARPARIDGPQPGEGEPEKGAAFLFRWQELDRTGTRYRFVLRAAGAAHARLVDETGLRVPRITLVNLPDGDYEWQVALQEVVDGELVETWLPPEQLRVGEGGPVVGWAESGAGPAGGGGGEAGAAGGSGPAAAAGGVAGRIIGSAPAVPWALGEGDALDPEMLPGGAGSGSASRAAGHGVRAAPLPPAPSFGWGSGGAFAGLGGGIGAGPGGGPRGDTGGGGSGPGGVPGGEGSPPPSVIPGLPAVPPPLAEPPPGPHGPGGSAGGGGLPPIESPGLGGPKVQPQLPSDVGAPVSPLPEPPPPPWTGSEPGRIIVPEPAAWLMLIAGFGLVGAALRLRARRARGARG